MKKNSKYPEPKRVKVGRVKYVCDFDGKALVGLSWDQGNGQYYYTYFKQEKDFLAGRTTRKDYSFGVKYDDAVFQFKQWKQETGKFTLSIPTDEVQAEQVITKTLSDKEREWYRQFYSDLGLDKEPPTSITFNGSGLEENSNTKIVSQVITDKKYSRHLLTQFLQDEELRIEAIKLLNQEHLMPKQYKSLSLKDVLQFYMDDNDCDPKEKKQVKLTVDHFIQITKKKQVNNITEDDILTYRDAIAALRKSTTFTNGRYTRIKTVLNYYNDNKQRNGEKELVKQVLGHCKKLHKIKTKIEDPANTFDVRTMKKLFTRAKKEESEVLLMCLLMLNTGYTPVDIRGLQKDMIRQQDGLTFIDFSRTKTDKQFIRINCLWGITAKLMEKHCKTHPSPFVFITKAKGAYTENTLYKKLRAFLETIKHTDGKTRSAKHFKDTVTSALAFDVVNMNLLKVTIGHTLSSSRDQFWKYVRTRPEQQKPAADILYSKFKPAIEVIE